MKCLVFGPDGQIGSELCRRVPADMHIIPLRRAEADLSDPASCASHIHATDADIIINAAAFTAVDLAEKEASQAMTVNAAAPTAMAAAAAKKNIPFLHISTDYVFDGKGDRPWRPDDRPAPLSVYGHSKLVGENGIRAAGGCHIILRTSWVFSAHRHNFVKTILSLCKQRNKLRIIADQFGGPTSAADIAAALFVIARKITTKRECSGTYHFSGTPDTSWAEFARTICKQAGIDVSIEDITTDDWPAEARRPANSRLDCNSLETVFNLRRPDWRASLTHVLTELKAL